jgi:hypothetical protein
MVIVNDQATYFQLGKYAVPPSYLPIPSTPTNRLNFSPRS